MTLLELIERLRREAQDRGYGSVTITVETNKVKDRRSSNLKWWVMFWIAFATMIAAYAALF